MFFWVPYCLFQWSTRWLFSSIGSPPKSLRRTRIWGRLLHLEPQNHLGETQTVSKSSQKPNHFEFRGLQAMKTYSKTEKRRWRTTYPALNCSKLAFDLPPSAEVARRLHSPSASRKELLSSPLWSGYSQTTERSCGVFLEEVRWEFNISKFDLST